MVVVLVADAELRFLARILDTALSALSALSSASSSSCCTLRYLAKLIAAISSYIEWSQQESLGWSPIILWFLIRELMPSYLQHLICSITWTNLFELTLSLLTIVLKICALVLNCDYNKVSINSLLCTTREIIKIL